MILHDKAVGGVVCGYKFGRYVVSDQVDLQRIRTFSNRQYTTQTIGIFDVGNCGSVIKCGEVETVACLLARDCSRELMHAVNLQGLGGGVYEGNVNTCDMTGFF